MVTWVLISTNEVILMKNFVDKEVYQVDQGGYMDEFEEIGLPMG